MFAVTSLKGSIYTLDPTSKLFLFIYKNNIFAWKISVYCKFKSGHKNIHF